MTRLLLRCDATATTGVGHLMRCLAVAEEATRRGWTVALLGAVTEIAWVEPALHALATDLLDPVDTANALAGLARDTAADVVWVDSYEMGDDLHPAVRTTGAVMVSVSDGTFGLRPADIVVDTNLRAPPGPPGDGLLLAGPAYALLRDVVVSARRARAAADASDRAPRVVVVMGGTDPAGLAQHAALIAADAGAGEVLVVTNAAPSAPALPDTVRFLAPHRDLPLTLAGADVVLSASGATTFELCCIGVPAALVWVAENQRAGYQALIDDGAVFGLGSAAHLREDPAAVTADLARLLSDAPLRARLGARARELVDGRGTARVLDAVDELRRAGAAADLAAADPKEEQRERPTVR